MHDILGISIANDSLVEHKITPLLRCYLLEFAFAKDELTMMAKPVYEAIISNTDDSPKLVVKLNENTVKVCHPEGSILLESKILYEINHIIILASMDNSVHCSSYSIIIILIRMINTLE